MSVRRWGRRAVLSGIGAVGALALGVGAASAHHCYVPMYSLSGPTSANWLVFSAEAGAAEFGLFSAECDEQVEAGYAALRAERLPVGIKIFDKMTIGNPKGDETGGSRNPNGANGKGLEYFGAGSTLADQMLMTWAEAASSTSCD